MVACPTYFDKKTSCVATFRNWVKHLKEKQLQINN